LKVAQKEDMSLFTWFTRKAGSSAGVTPVPKSDPGLIAVTTPTSTLVPPTQAAASRKIERSAHREFLYSVVRDAMIRAGVLAASYKFKVLSLDARGRQYLIMMDIDRQAMGLISKLSEIETTMIQAAKARHDLLVTAVYWRANERAETGLLTNPSELAPRSTGAMQTVLDEDVADFKRELASSAPTKPEQTRHTGASKGHPAPAEEFQDTQIVPSDTHSSPLGITQYGELK
jgi:hypothetical protein